MAKPATRKEESHQRILRAASRALRKHGYEGLGVADVMKDAGLTHGGFYAHFATRDALLAEAADHAGAESVESLTRAVSGAKPGQALDALVESYLSDRHLHSEDRACSIAAAGSEVARQAPDVRRAATRRMKELVDLIERQMPGWRKPGNHEKAMAVLSALAGAMVIARASDDAEFSRAVRKATRQALKTI